MTKKSKYVTHGVRRFYPPTESDIPMHGWAPYSNMHHERIRAHEKHGGKPGGSMEMKSFDEPDWLAVLTEELGECAKEICDFRHGIFDRREFAERLRAELIQVGAMTAAWIDAIDLEQWGNVKCKECHFGRINGSTTDWCLKCGGNGYHLGEPS